MENYVEEYRAKYVPLAEKMRARNLDEFIGQKHIVGKDSLIRRAISVNRLGSCIFYGTPGVGKSTLAFIIANSLNLESVKLNAVSSGVGDAKKVIESAKSSYEFWTNVIDGARHRVIVFWKQWNEDIFCLLVQQQKILILV